MKRSRRAFLGSLTGLGASLSSASSLTRARTVAASPPAESESPAAGAGTVRLRPGGSDDGFDPWIEIDAAAVRSNVREASRLAGGRPILAVVKNNAYGLGDALVGPILDACDEVSAIACVRVSEVLAMRAAGVRKPMLNMAEVSASEAEELARNDARPSLWLDDAGERMDQVARKLGRPVPVHLYLDCGMGREGMPDHRALPWIEDLAHRPSVRVDGTYMMFVHELEFDREQLGRFQKITGEARSRGIDLGRLHTAPTYELFFLPEAHLDMVRISGALLGIYPGDERARSMASLKPVFRLCARVVRLERLRPGDSASFGRKFIAERPTWVALLPVGHTDGYPTGVANRSKVLIGGRLYPVVAVVSSTHTIVEIGEEKTVAIGDVATLMGPDDPAIEPERIADESGTGYFTMLTKLSALLPRRLA
jgi:alanine racemase